MGYSQVDLENKLMEMYPEFNEHGIDISMDFSDDKNAWIIKLAKQGHGLSTHLNKKDADECMSGIKCVYLGVQIGEFIDNFERP